MTKKIVTLAHYYTIPEVQQLADRVGDSLDLALYAANCDADVIIFAGVRFMAETAKIINPKATVILPDMGSTCSLVTMTNIDELAAWRAKYHDYVHVAYINSSAEHKALADYTVTSRNVSDIIAHLYATGQKVIYSPDRNMGAYLNFTYGYNMPLWHAICEVHDKFNKTALDQLMQNTSDPKYLIAHPESPLPVLQAANYIGSTHGLLNWIKNFDINAKDKAKYVVQNAKILVATEDGILYNMRQARPELNIQLAPIYNGCQCNSCPYMKLNTVEAVKQAQQQQSGSIIDYLSDGLIAKAKVPIQRMLDFNYI